MLWSVGITTAPRLEYTLSRTIVSLHEAGWFGSDMCIVGEPGSRMDVECVLPPQPTVAVPFLNTMRIGAWPNWLGAANIALNASPAAEAVLISQDDVIYSKGLRDYLDAALWPEDRDRVGCVSLFTCGAQYPTGDGWWQLPQNVLPRKTYGGIALVFPRRSLELLVADPPGRGSLTKVDIWVGHHCANHGLSYWLHSPSLAQHIGDRSAINPDNDQRRPEFRKAFDFCTDVTNLAGNTT